MKRNVLQPTDECECGRPAVKLLTNGERVCQRCLDLQAQARRRVDTVLANVDPKPTPVPWITGYPMPKGMTI